MLFSQQLTYFILVHKQEAASLLESWVRLLQPHPGEGCVFVFWVWTPGCVRPGGPDTCSIQCLAVHHCSAEQALWLFFFFFLNN